MAKLIVLDGDPRLLEIVKYVIEYHFSIETLLADSTENLKSALDTHGSVTCIIVDSFLALGSWDQLLSALNERTPVPSLIFCGDPFANKSVLDLSGQLTVPIAGYVEKPHIIEPIVNLLKGIGKPPGTSDKSPPSSYIPVSRNILGALEQVPVDLFIRISAEKYVHILNAGDALGPSPLIALKDRAQDPLFVRGQDADKLVRTFEGWLQRLRKKAPAFVPANDFPVSVSVLCTLQGLFKSLWLSAEVQEAARATVSLVLEQLEHEPRIEPFLRLLAKRQESYIASHSMVLAYLSCAFSRTLGWNSEFTLRKLALASVMHDIVLDQDELGRVRTIGELAHLKMRKRNCDAQAVENHPVLVAELVRSMRDYPLGVDTVIAQHHELPDGMGFPVSASSRKIEPLSALFILLHDFVDRVLGQEDWASYQRALSEMAPDYQRKPFAPLFKAFRAMFESNAP